MFKSKRSRTMKAAFVLALFVCCVASIEYPHTPEYVQEIADQATTWTAGINENFLGWSHDDLLSIMCHNKGKEPKLPVSKPIDMASDVLPVNFTASEHWTKCPNIGKIYNQARCGSCWAFGGVEAASDRFCIASNGAFTKELSFAQVTECDYGSDGCDGGTAGSTWNFIQDNGIVTDDCYPYYVPTCPPSQQPCLNFVDTPSCWSNQTCVNGAKWETHTVTNSYYIDSVEEAMKQIMTKGPIEACFEVYSDFVHYKSGVYRHTTGSFLGGHCIKISGWGVQNGLKFWLVNNSWTTSWGDKGYFKIERGVNMCGIESDLVAGDPDVSSLQ